jgi:fucose 4-O-acetylase-like acetyltransferase
MDALRASTMLLLVPVHAAMLLAVNGHPGAWASAIYWLIHLFRLPLFFAMSGFFLALLLSRRGAGSTLRNRSLRVAVPLAVGLFTLVPLLIAASQATGIAISGDGLPQGGAFKVQLSFLWFLWYLLILDGIAFSTYLLAPRVAQRLGHGMKWAIATPLAGIALLAVPTALALWQQPEWTAAAPADSFVPDPSTLAYYALFFALGATLCRHRELVDAARRDAWKWAACAAAATLPAAALFASHNSPQLAGRTAVHGAALLIYAVATWTCLIALVGLASRYLNRPRTAFRYMADSSYWIYLFHLTPMVLLIALLSRSGLGTPLQFALVIAGSLATSLATYPLLVRYTPIGWVLNGRRERTRPPLWRAALPVTAPGAPTRPAA